jgi:hypothetical protein
MVPDFTGYVTRSNLKCADGRTIMSHAFQGNDGQTVPLVWHHQHDAPENVLGHVILHSREEGVWGEGFFNDTPTGQNAKKLVIHKDIKALSIYANQLVQQALNVVHGVIREVSLVMSGANPGAFIDNVNLAHGDGFNAIEDEAIIYTNETISLGSHLAPAVVSAAIPPKPDLEAIAEEITHAVDLGAAEGAAQSVDTLPSVNDIMNSLTEVQRNVVFALIGRAMEMQQSAMTGDQSDTTITSSDPEGDDQVTHNIFDQTDGGKDAAVSNAPVLSHADVKGIVADAMRCGSLKEAVTNYALQHNIDNVDVLFPDARNLTDQPDFISRRTEWVAGVLAGTRKSPFARVKTILADITQDEARAKGYIKGNVKAEEFFGVSRRTTTPTTVYKKQKLDRDDVIDITDFDAVVWIKGEMRLMLEEEIARAILIGDGRQVTDADKVKDPAGAADGAGIRSILNDHDMYVTTVQVNQGSTPDPDKIVDGVVQAMRYYHGTGMPVLYTTLPVLTSMLLKKDTLGRRIYSTQAELASALMVRDIVTVEPMEQVTNLLGVVVNLNDYNVGTDRGGEVNTFDDFDIDFNQLKYLIETRLSGALVKYKAALVIMNRLSTDTLIDPVTAPTMNSSTWVVTIPTLTHVTYKNNDTQATLSAGAQAALASGAKLNVIAVPDATYYFATDALDEWTFYHRPS